MRNDISSRVEHELVTQLLPEERQLAVARATQATSLEYLMKPFEISPEQEERLPYLLLQQTAVSQSAWAHIAKTLRIIRDREIWKKIDGGKYAEDFDGFLKTFTSGMDFSAGRVSNLLGYYNWFEANYAKITAAKPAESTYDTPQIPRERTMRLVMQYHEAFEESPKLVEMVFWRGSIDHDYLLAEIAAEKGDAYVASRQPASFRTRQLGGNMNRPTFGPASRSRTDPNSVISNAIGTVFQRVYDMVVEQGLYTKMDPAARERFRTQLERITETVIAAEGAYTRQV